MSNNCSMSNSTSNSLSPLKLFSTLFLSMFSKFQFMGCNVEKLSSVEHLKKSLVCLRACQSLLSLKVGTVSLYSLLFHVFDSS